MPASDEAGIKDASAAYPGLEKMFAAEDAARRTVGAKAMTTPAAATAFMSRFRENTAIAIHTGREIPQVETAKRPSEVRR